MKKSFKTIFLVVLIISASLSLFTRDVYARENARDIRFEHITIKQGLSQNSISCILRDSRGFMWFGTTEGLNKYDGYDFTPYLHTLEDPTSISDSHINTIYEDRWEILWIGTRGGLNRLDRNSERFTHYQYDPQNSQSLSHSDVRTICEDKAGNLWIGTGRGLNRFDRNKNTFKRYLHDPQNPESLSNNWVAAIYKDKAGILWIGTGKGLNRFDPARETFTHYLYDQHDPASLNHNNIYSMYEDKSGKLWLGTRRGLKRFDRNREIFTCYLIDPENPGDMSRNRIMAIDEDEHGMLWLATRGGGLNIFNPENERFTRYSHKPQNPESLSINDVMAIYNDGTGILWVGTFGGGINKFAYEQRKFSHYSHDPRDSESLSYNDVMSVYEDSTGRLWIATFGGGLNRFDPKEKTFSNYTHDPQNPISLSTDTALSVHQDSSGILWIGTLAGLNRFDPKDRIFTRYQHDGQNSESLSNNSISAIQEDSAKNLWVGTWNGGLNLFDRKTETFTHFVHDDGNPESLSHNRVRAIYEDSSETLWVGTNIGLNRFVRETETFQRYFHDPENPESLSSSKIRCICEDRAKNLWIGTGRGLNKFDRKTETFIWYTKRDGLPNNVIYCISEDDHDNLWVSTNRGLSRFNPKNMTFKNYSEDDGLQSDEFNTGTCCRTRSGDMVFGGINGFNIFDPENIPENIHIPPVRITDFQKFSKNVKLETHISELSEITLSYKDYVFSLEFAALDYTAPNKNQYAYMLEGFEKDWNYTDAKRRFATYTNLRGGEYIFRVRGSNNDGVWNEEGASLRITVTPPWWETWWFKTIAAFLILGSAFGAYRWRVRALEYRGRELECQVSERTKELAVAKEKAEIANQAKSTFLANMSHELRTPLNVILGFSRMLGRSANLGPEEKKNTSVICRSGEHLLNLINDVLEMSRIEAGRIVLSENDFDLHRILDDVKDMFFLKSREKGLRLISECDAGVPRYIRTDEAKLRQVLVNLIGNAVKFTEKGGIFLRVRQLSDEGGEEKKADFQFEIKDTGEGIAPDELGSLFDAFVQTETGRKSQEGTGLGLLISRKFVQMMGGDITVESEAGRGTVFRFGIQARIADSSEILTEKPERRVTAMAPEQPKYRILIADDNKPNRTLLLRLLALPGFELREAENGKEAVEIWEKWEPHLIFMDIRMPVMDGCNATKAIRSSTASNPQHATRNTVIIAVTASVFEEDRILVMSAGCDDFIRKPFEDTKVFEVIKQHLGVQFIYEDTEGSMKRENGDKNATLMQENLATLPHELLSELKQAATDGDSERLHQTIAGIRPHNAGLADELTGLTDDFAFDTILDMIQKLLQED
ncbi:MAG: response regulator [Desulfobacterales bacterium]|nr:response regulator [Desulfobacterales bacterium]